MQLNHKKNNLDVDTNILLEVQNLGVKSDGKWLIKNVDISLKRGEIVTLIGPNGAGKSTCVKAILTLVTKQEGTVTFSPDIKIGYVPQKLNIDWTMPLTVRRLMTLTQSHKPDEIAAALEHVNILHLADRMLQNLSGGEFQRLLLARALIRKPDLLILDEPVQGVDFSGEIALYELIQEVRKELNCGILLISHDLHIVMAETDHGICLNGHVCCSGHPTLVAKDEEYQRLFGPRAANVMAVYSHEHDDKHKCDH